MPLFITSLNSGSNGNCYYVGNDTEAVLVDAGISCTEIEKRMKRLGLTMQKVKAVFVSHEHTDHISGVQVLAKKHNLHVYITHATHRFSRLKLDKNLILNFFSHTPITIGNLSITAFPKFHDAADPYSFIISCNKINVGVFTDIGAHCEHLINNFKNATELGAEVLQKKCGNIAEGIMEAVNEKQITTVCLGKPHLNLFQVILRTNVFNQLLKTLSQNDVDLVILS